MINLTAHYQNVRGCTIKVVWCFNEAMFAHLQTKCFRALDAASSFATSGVHHIAMTGTVLHNIIVQEVWVPGPSSTSPVAIFKLCS